MEAAATTGPTPTTAPGRPEFFTRSSSDQHVPLRGGLCSVTSGTDSFWLEILTVGQNFLDVSLHTHRAPHAQDLALFVEHEG